MKLLQIPSTITKVTSMSHRSLRLMVDSNENLTDEQMARVMSYLNKYGWFSFSVEEAIELDDVLTLPPLPKQEEGEKSPGQRLRAVLYRYWEHKGKPTETFEEYYRISMEKIINQIKEKLT